MELNAKTKEEMDKAVAKTLSEVDDLFFLMQSGYWRKLPRKKKKREKKEKQFHYSFIVIFIIRN